MARSKSAVSHRVSLEFGRFEFRWAALAGLLLAQVVSLQAHDIYSSWAETRLFPDKLLLTLTLARSSALDLLPSGRPRPPITPQTFADVAPDLRAVAPELLRISDGDTVLPLQSVEVSINGDNDIAFNLAYARPKVGRSNFISTTCGTWLMATSPPSSFPTRTVMILAGRR